jgi:hypothetical protein
MRDLSPKIGISIVLLTAFCRVAGAQAVTEYGSMASKSATVGKRANSISNEIGGIWRSVDKTINGSKSHASSSRASSGRTTRRTPARGKRPVPAAPSTAHEDPRRIQPGISYAELMRRCGPAFFEVATGPTTKTVTYAGKDGDIDLELVDGKVTRVITPKSREVATITPK